MVATQKIQKKMSNEPNNLESTASTSDAQDEVIEDVIVIHPGTCEFIFATSIQEAPLAMPHIMGIRMKDAKEYKNSVRKKNSCDSCCSHNSKQHQQQPRRQNYYVFAKNYLYNAIWYNQKMQPLTKKRKFILKKFPSRRCKMSPTLSNLVYLPILVNFHRRDNGW